jgi:eukaryotic-like serine/threonine-protein kinase
MATARNALLPFPLSKELAGRSVGRFLIRSKIGSGGIGEVYYAEDPALRRPVALKRITHKLGSDPEAREEILREARRASVLASEHIAAVHDVLEEAGELFLVMEYVDGVTLRHRLCRPISFDQFFTIATQCAEALVAAHEHGIIHCDIKPENIMLTSAGQVKILDFGLAKHLPRSDKSSTLESKSLGGTPAYMAPEVLLQNLPDARSDIFSLGVVLYEMLTLKNPFATTSFVATTEKILHEKPAPMRALNAAVPQELEAVVMKAMAKKFAERYANARELLDDLRRLQAGELPRPVPSAVTPQEVRKHWLLAVVVLVAVIAFALAAYRWTHRQPVLAERGWILISDFDTSGDEAIPDKGVREALTIALQQSRYVNVFPRSRAYETLQRMKKQDAPRIEEALGREICQRENLRVLLSGSVEHIGQMFQISVRGLDPVHGSVLFVERERLDRKDQLFDKVDLLAKGVRKDLGESLVGIEKNSRSLAKVTTSSLEALQLYSKAQDAQNQGKDDQVEGLLKGALQFDPSFAMAHLQLGQHYSMGGGKNEKTVAELEEAYRLRQGVSERERYRIEAGYYSLQERYEDEAQSLKLLVDLYPDDEEAHQELAGAYYDLDQLDKAAIHLREVLRLDPFSAPAYRSLVLYLAGSDQAQAAIAAYNEAHQHGVDPPQMHWGLGLAYLGLGQVLTAKEEFQRIGQATEEDRDLEEQYLVVADLYEGKLDQAKTRLAELIQAVPQQTGGLQAIRRYLLGRIYLSRNSSQMAKREADFLLQVPKTGLQIYDLLNAGILYSRTGDTYMARQMLRRLDHSRKLVSSSWNQSCFHNLEGEIQLASARPREAESSFAVAVQKYPDAFSHAGLARSYQAQKRWTLAAQEWEQVLNRKVDILEHGYPPDVAFAHLQLARAYGQLKQRDLARSHYEEVLRMWQNADALSLLADAQRELLNLTP